ncbi:MAG TPA: ornithine carbamoyltransferase [Candidatus Hydrogenedentes bacterium]|nr:ornithine carbamoyltransferase [Candidatus Hydrogenedentota bacterium]HNT88476.1 ornithine carbamoyltransferase [Candidatus Hydrogenedentota bacterium]
MVTDFLSFAGLSPDEITALLDLADELKRKQRQGVEHHYLKGKTLAMIFEKASLRTRVTFEVGMFQLGGLAVLLETELGKRESVPDVARNLDRWVQGIVARTFRHDDVVTLAAHASVPVINALTDKLHPCQILADVQTLREHKGRNLAGVKVAFVGDGNNVFNSWAEFALHFPIDLRLACPPGYEGDAALLAAVRDRGKGSVLVTHDPGEGVKGVDVVYTDVWTSMGQEGEAAERNAAFAPYQVNANLMALADPDAIFMHCLPAKRGLEVTDDVIDGPRSVVFDEAENRMHTQKAVLVTLMG